MLKDRELARLVEQAGRNLSTLELLARSAGEPDLGNIDELQQRLRRLKEAYRRETDALTREVLKRAVERRVAERRHGAPGDPICQENSP